MKDKDKKREKKIAKDPSNKYLLEQHSLGEKLVFITYEGRIEGVITSYSIHYTKLYDQSDCSEYLCVPYVPAPVSGFKIRYFCKTEKEHSANKKTSA